MLARSGGSPRALHPRSEKWCWGDRRGVPNSQVTEGRGLCQAQKIYEAPMECRPGLAQAACAPHFIFDFHLIIFFLPLSTQCPEW